MSHTQKKYRGRLSLEQIAEGIAACLQNARALVEDAIVLLRAKRHPRALTCLLAAKQELGKVDVLGAMARIDDQKQEHWADLWKSFHSHVVKGTHAAVQTTPDQLRGSFDSVFAAIPGSFQIASSEEELRQASLYVAFEYRPSRSGKTPRINAESIGEIRALPELGVVLCTSSQHST